MSGKLSKQKPMLRVMVGGGGCSESWVLEVLGRPGLGKVALEGLMQGKARTQWVQGRARTEPAILRQQRCA